MGLHLAVLLIDESPQLALHGLESVMDHFRQRRVGAVVHPLFLRDQLVAGRHRHVDPDPERIAFLMGVVRLLNGDIAPVDVVAELFQAGRLFQDELIDVVGFLDAAVGDVNSELHKV